MSIHGSKKEEIFKLLLLFNPAIIENLLDIKLDSLEYEAYQNKRYIDLLGTAKDSNLDIFIEVQLTHSDSDHYERLIEICEKNDNAMIVWIAPSFDHQWTESIINEINFTFAKFINFYAVTFDVSILEWIESINKKTDREKYDEIKRSSNRVLLAIEDQVEIIPEDYEAPKKEGDFELPMVKRNKKLLNQMYEKSPFSFNLLRSKSAIHRPCMHVGAGKSYLTYSITSEREGIGIFRIALLLSEKSRQKEFNKIYNKIQERRQDFHSCHITKSKAKIEISLIGEYPIEVKIDKLSDAFRILHEIVLDHIENHERH